MGTYQDSDEIRRNYVEKMGDPLGGYFFLLSQEIVHLHFKWQEFIRLFGEDPANIDILNQAAPLFFKTVQDIWIQDIMLHIARLTDPPESGRKGKTNFTLMRLPQLIDKPELNKQITEKLEDLKSKIQRLRDWRNRRIAHRDLELMFGGSSLLPTVGRQYLEEVLQAIRDVMNTIENKYMGSSTYFEDVTTQGSVRSLLFYLEKGLICRKQEIESKLK